MEKIRLQKFLAECGIASRRKCEEYIMQGKVKINGKNNVVKAPEKCTNFLVTSISHPFLRIISAITNIVKNIVEITIAQIKLVIFYNLICEKCFVEKCLIFKV